MITLRQHIPAFCEGFTAKIARVATQEELFATPWVAAYAADVEPVERPGVVQAMDAQRQWVRVPVIYDPPREERFFQWSLSCDHDALLMVEHNNGRIWHVVGRVVTGLHDLTLPRWVPNRAGPEDPRQQVGLGYRCALHDVRDAACCLPQVPPRR